MSETIATWVIAIATLMATLATLLGAEFLRAFVKNSLIKITRYIAKKLYNNWRLIGRIVISVFCLCWVPLGILKFWPILSEQLSGNINLMIVIIAISMISAIVATILAIGHKKIRMYHHMIKTEGMPERKNSEITENNINTYNEIALSEVAYEVSNKSFLIKGIADLLLADSKQYLRTAKAEEYIKSISDKSQNIFRLTNALLDYIRFSNSTVEVNLSALCDDILYLVQYKIEENNIKLVKKYSKGLIIVNGNKNQLERVLINTILNAINGMRSGGTLTLETLYSLKEARVVISDTRIGLSRGDLGEVFQSSSVKKQGKKENGLDISKRIIQENGGKITVKSKLGERTIFTISLPLEQYNG